MLATYIHRGAAWLLRSAIRIAPQDTRDWGEAMLGELTHVESAWAALMWALGGASVLAKHRLVVVFFPDRHRPATPPHGNLFSSEVAMRKTILVAGGGCVLAAVVLFVAPSFRRAFRVSLTPWSQVFYVDSWPRQLGLEALAKRARAQHDPEGLAFVAVRLRDGAESAKLAEEAVQLNPNLIWVYAIVAVRHPDLGEINKWVPKLERWDPQNTLVHFIKVECIDIDYVRGASKLPPKEMRKKTEEDPEWQQAMAAAFRSPRFDDYLDRLTELDRKIVSHYGFNDPIQVLAGGDCALPTYAYQDSHRFAKSLFQSGQDLEARDDREGALREYWAVARFGQVIDSQGHTDSEHLPGTSLQAAAYKRLQALSEKEGRHEQAALFGYLAAKFDRARGEGEMLVRQGFPGRPVSSWDASVVKVSGLMMLVFGGLAGICALTAIARSRRTRPNALHADRATTALGLTSAVGLLLSSATLCATYYPYSEIFERFIHHGERTQVVELTAFFRGTQTLLGVRDFYQTRDFVFYFWGGVSLVGVIGLLLVVVRHLSKRRQASAPA